MRSLRGGSQATVALRPAVGAQLVQLTAAQLLGTRGDVGYLVTDSASGTTQPIVNQIRAMPETIRLRVLM